MRMSPSLGVVDTGKLACWRRLSSSLAVLLGFVIWAVTAAQAHEVRPAVADVTVSAAEVRLEIRLALEAMVAGIDLDGLADTDDAPEAERYDTLRALDPEALAEAARTAWPDLAGGVLLAAGETALTAEIAEIVVPEIGDVDLPRDSVLTLTAALPADGTPVTVGWVAAYGPLVVRQTGAGEDAYTGYLTGGQVSDALPRAGAAQTALQAFGQYVVIGFQQLVPKGPDHVLFVLGLFFFSLQLRPLVLQVASFTVAHSVTLALATLGYVTVSPAIVGPLIAASIVYVGVANALQTRITQWRMAAVFGFGLVHGLGFAAALGEVGLPPAHFAGGLAGFNIGVELGQLAVLAVAFLAVGYWFGDKPWYRGRIAVPASLAIAAVGAYWVVERTVL